MRKYQSLFTYLLLFLALALILKLFGFIHLSGWAIFGYALIFYGISDVYLSLGKNRKISLFFGTVLFLIGILIYVLNNFLIFWGMAVLIPSVFFIPGIAYLMLSYDNPSVKKYYIIGIVLILAGLFTTVINGQFNFSSFYHSMLKITSYYWQIVLIITVILIFITFEEKN